jgi:RNA-directed DNA polymerase
LIEFGRHAAWKRRRRDLGKPETFDFLGFPHICAKNRAGRFWIKRITIAKRLRAKLAQVKTELKARRQLPISVQGQWLATVLRGHYAYYAVPGNSDAVQVFRFQVIGHGRKSLRRRSQRARLNWARMKPIANRWLPRPRVMHPFPEVRLAART